MNRVVDRPLISRTEKMLTKTFEDKRYYLFDYNEQHDGKRWRFIVDGKFSFVVDLYTQKERDFLNVSTALYKMEDEVFNDVAVELLELNEKLSFVGKFGRQSNLLTCSVKFTLDSMNMDYIRDTVARFIDTAEYFTNPISKKYDLTHLMHANTFEVKKSLN